MITGTDSLKAQWVQQPQFHTGNTLFDVRVLPDGSGIVVGEGNVLLCTLNEGDTWTGTGSSAPDLTTASLAEDIFYFANRQGAIFRETNPGTCDNELVAAAVPVLNTLTDLQMFDANEGYALAGGALRYTNNGWAGSTAVSNIGCPLDALAIWFVSPELGFAATAAGRVVQIRLNSGTFFCENKSGTGPALRGLHFADGLNGYAVGDEARVLHTEDGGVSWVDRSFFADDDLTAVFAFPGGVVHAGGRGLFKSTNSGLTWLRQENPPTMVQALSMWFADTNRGWITGPAGFIGYTGNGGGDGLPLGEHWIAYGEHTWTFWPNPAQETLQISLKDKQERPWQLLRSDGKPVLSGIVRGSAQINVADLPPGPYFLQIGQLEGKLVVLANQP